MLGTKRLDLLLIPKAAETADDYLLDVHGALHSKVSDVSLAWFFKGTSEKPSLYNRMNQKYLYPRPVRIKLTLHTELFAFTCYNYWLNVVLELSPEIFKISGYS